MLFFAAVIARQDFVNGSVAGSYARGSFVEICRSLRSVAAYQLGFRREVQVKVCWLFPAAVYKHKEAAAVVADLRNRNSAICNGKGVNAFGKCGQRMRAFGQRVAQMVDRRNLTAKEYESPVLYLAVYRACEFVNMSAHSVVADRGFVVVERAVVVWRTPISEILQPLCAVCKSCIELQP